MGSAQGLFREDRKRRGYGGVHIGPWKETDMLSGDQEVVHPITCMHNFLVSTKDYLERIGHEGAMVESILVHGRKRTCSVETLVETRKLYMHVIGCTTSWSPPRNFIIQEGRTVT